MVLRVSGHKRSAPGHRAKRTNARGALPAQGRTLRHWKAEVRPAEVKCRRWRHVRTGHCCPLRQDSAAQSWPKRRLDDWLNRAEAARVEAHKCLATEVNQIQSWSGVVVPDSACHAGGRGFESRPSRKIPANMRPRGSSATCRSGRAWQWRNSLDPRPAASSPRPRERRSLRIARNLETFVGDPLLLRQLLKRSFHGNRSEPARTLVVGMVEEPEEEQGGGDHGRDAAHHRRLHDHSLAAVCEEEHEDEDESCAQKEDDPERRRDHAFSTVSPVGARGLAVGALIEPLAVGGLLGRRARLDSLQGAEHGQPPRVVSGAEGARLHPRPFLAYYGARVADELTREATTHREGHELGRLELLRDDLRLAHSAAARGVEALEGKEDDEAK